MVFQTYSTYYDLFYRDKNYQSEVDYVIQLGNFVPPMSILDLGCGTGGHVLPFATRGFQMTGVDISEGMIRQAKQKVSEGGLNAEFLLHDISSLNLGKQFDAVISMFAVMGYQITNTALHSTMLAVRKHLHTGSLFIFDTWYGPAVLQEKPEVRIREIQDNDTRVLRMVSPVVDSLQNTVTVNYQVMRLDGSQVLDETHESHAMRYFFAPEIAFFAQQSGFIVEKIYPFMEWGRQPNDQDWNVTWVLRAV